MKSLKSPSPNYHKPRTVEEMTQRNVETIVQLEEAAKANRCKSDQIADGALAAEKLEDVLWQLYVRMGASHLVWRLDYH